MKNNQDINYIYEKIIEENEEKNLNTLWIIYNNKVRNLNRDLVTLRGYITLLYDEESIKGINRTYKIIEYNKDFYKGLVKYIINKVVNKND